MSHTKQFASGMVFGVFDGFHPGHFYFLSEAYNQCEQLFVVVTPPEIVFTLKGKYPRFSFEERSEQIKQSFPSVRIVPGDDLLGSWEVLKENAPDVVFLGHDQQAIAEELKKLSIAYTFIDGFEPEKHKTSLLKLHKEK